MNSVKLLCVAVVEQARIDFFKWYGKKKYKERYDELIEELTSEEFEDCFLPGDITGEELVQMWIAQAKKKVR